MTAPLNLACRPSPDEIIEARRDWFDAHADYAMTGQPRYRDERDSYEDDDPMRQIEAHIVASIRAAGWNGAAKLAAVVLGVAATVLYGGWLTASVLAWTGGAL